MFQIYRTILNSEFSILNSGDSSSPFMAGKTMLNDKCWMLNEKITFIQHLSLRIQHCFPIHHFKMLHCRHFSIEHLAFSIWILALPGRGVVKGIVHVSEQCIHPCNPKDPCSIHPIGKYWRTRRNENQQWSTCASGCPRCGRRRAGGSVRSSTSRHATRGWI